MKNQLSTLFSALIPTLISKLCSLTTLVILLSSTHLYAEVISEDISSKKVIKPFIARYDLLKKSDSVGEAVRTLEYNADHSASYSYKTDASWFIFTDLREETSITKLDDNKITPTHYYYKRSGTGNNKSYEWTFDVDNDLASDVKKAKQLTIQFPEKIQDKLSYQLQLRLDLIKDSAKEIYTYPVISTSGKIKNYTFVNEGEEIIILPFGEVTAIKLKRDVKDSKKITYAWFAPDLNYLLVRLYQMKNGKSQFNAELKTVDILETSAIEQSIEKLSTDDLSTKK